jgi:hypothetical protein
VHVASGHGEREGVAAETLRDRSPVLDAEPLQQLLRLRARQIAERDRLEAAPLPWRKIDRDEAGRDEDLGPPESGRRGAEQPPQGGVLELSARPRTSAVRLGDLESVEDEQAASPAQRQLQLVGPGSGRRARTEASQRRV